MWESEHWENIYKNWILNTEFLQLVGVIVGIKLDSHMVCHLQNAQ